MAGKGFLTVSLTQPNQYQPSHVLFETEKKAKKNYYLLYGQKINQCYLKKVIIANFDMCNGRQAFCLPYDTFSSSLLNIMASTS